MSWWRLEACARNNRKVKAAGDSAAWLWASCAMYAAEQHTDGFVPDDELDEMVKRASDPGAFGKCLKLVLLEKVDGGVQVHDFLDYNVSSSEAKRLSRDRSRAGRLGALAKHGTCQKQPPQATATSKRLSVLSDPSDPIPPLQKGVQEEERPKGRLLGIIDPDSSPDGLQNPERVRRFFCRLWRSKYGSNYPQEPEKDNAQAVLLLKKHRQLGIKSPWEEWVQQVVRAYLEIDDDRLVTSDNHAFRHIGMKMQKIVGMMGGST